MGNRHFYEELKRLDLSYYEEFGDEFLKKLFPLNRSILNNGVEETYKILQEKLDFEIIKLPTGMECYDWIIPDQWEIKEAFIEVDGNKILDFKNNNLHILNYSEAVDEIISFSELEEHLYYLKDQPDAIPYKTSYYKRNWGFCLTYNQFLSLDRDKMYKVKVLSEFSKGNIIIAEKLLKGISEEEILISAYSCHPSMANDSLSGVVVWAMLLKFLSSQKRLNYSYRFVLLPETIGAIAYLKHREEAVKQNVKYGFVLTTCGGPGQFGYKYSFKGNALNDRCIEMTFKEEGVNYIKYPFDISGSDERQYSSPFFRIPCGTISKDKYYEYKEYHTSLDNLDFVKSKFLFETFFLYLLTFQKFELSGIKYLSLNPAGEPFLTKRDIYSTIGITISNVLDNSCHHKYKEYSTVDKHRITGEEIDLVLWLMFWSDGTKSLFEIAEITGKSFYQLYKLATLLVEIKLIKQI